MNRYARQMMLPEIGQAGQNRLRAARVLVVGAGGLGCPVLAYLVGAGVGHITVVDPDVVELGNLHRQPLFTMHDIGTSKAESARDRLLAVNPDVDIRAMPVALDPANAKQWVEPSDLVVDAADSFAVSYTLSDICLAHRVPLISASVLGHSGYVGGFCANVPSLRAVFPDLPDKAANCASAGVAGPVVGMVGAMQVQLAMQVLTGRQNAMGQLTTIDAENGRFGGFDFCSAAEPDVIIPFIARSHCRSVDWVVDLRSEAEAAAVPLPGSHRHAGGAGDGFVVPRGRRIVLCCTSGLRAWRAASRLRRQGYDDLAILAVGHRA